MKATIVAVGFMGILSILLVREFSPRTVEACLQTANDIFAESVNKDDAQLPDLQKLNARRAAIGRLPLQFEKNQGQIDSRVNYLSRGAGYDFFLTAGETVMSLHAPDQNQAAVVRTKFIGANPRPEIAGEGELTGKLNYFIGNDPSKWRTGVSTYSKVRYRNIYRGVDAVYYGNQRQLEYDLVVAPAANARNIKLSISGADDLRIDGNGDLVLRIGNRELRQLKPTAYQELNNARQEAAANYVLSANREISIDVPSYDTSKPLIIDPVLFYSSFLGGSGLDEGHDVAVDSNGNAYITGRTQSANFPVNNAAQSSRAGAEDVFVTKFSPDGSALLYSTYLGGTEGSNNEVGHGIAVDSSGNAYITGETGASNFPTTAGVLKATFGGAVDAFVTKLGPGGALVYSTYLSGAGGFNEVGRSIAVDAAGNAYVTGFTGNSTFPLVNPFQSTIGGTGSAFISKLNPTGSALVYSSFLGTAGEVGRSIKVDSTGSAYLAGSTRSTAFPVVNAFQSAYAGGSANPFDVFVTRVNSAGSALVYSTYLGGTGDDVLGGSAAITGSSAGQGLAIDDFGNAYVTGSTSSTNLPVKNAFQSTNQSTGSGGLDVFVTKLNTNSSGAASLVYSTYLGGASDDSGSGIAVNVLGQAYVTGGTSSTNFPVASPIQATLPSINSMFLTKLSASGSALVYSTYFGGNLFTKGYDVAVDSAGNAFVTGSTSATNFITTSNAFQKTNSGGNGDAFSTVVADPTIIGRVVDENNNGIAGATVNLSGVPFGTTTTDANGYYTFGFLTVGNNYTVSVSVANYIYNSQSVNNLQKNVRLDFAPVVVTISGQVTLGSAGLDAVTMTLTVGKSLSAQTNASGNYSFPNLPAGRNYTVTPSKPAFGFVPANASFANVLINQTANFIAQATIQFNVGSYVANEADGRATITITRTSGASGPASVRYSISDGTAKQKSDYILAFGTLRMAAGETSKSFQVLIVNDVYVEGDEFFFVTLSDPVGASLGIPNPAMVTITDDDTVPPTSNPIDQSRFFVQEHYYDFLSRYPDPSGWDFWTNNIDNCTPKPSCTGLRLIDTSAAYFLSVEFQQTGYLVERIHKVSFGDASGTSTLGGAHQLAVPTVRFPDFISDTEEIGDGLVVGQTGWETVLENNKQAFTADFVQRSRFTTAFPTSMTPAQYVDKLNQNAGNVLSTSDRATAIALFGGATDTSNLTARAQALRQVAENQNLATAEFNRAFVLMQFFGYLRRNPNDLPDADYTGYDFWLTKLNQFNGNYNAAEMVKAFIVSTEYRQRFGP
jgi:hypothetical protein